MVFGMQEAARVVFVWRGHGCSLRQLRRCSVQCDALIHGSATATASRESTIHDAKIFLNRSSLVSSPSLLGRLLEQLLDDRVGGDAFGGGGEVGQDAMPQHRVGQRLDVLVCTCVRP